MWCIGKDVLWRRTLESSFLVTFGAAGNPNVTSSAGLHGDFCYEVAFCRNGFSANGTLAFSGTFILGFITVGTTVHVTGLFLSCIVRQRTVDSGDNILTGQK